jgi:hypothetical protein
MPPPCGVESHACCYSARDLICSFKTAGCSNKRENFTPQGGGIFIAPLRLPVVATNVKTPPRKAVASSLLL